MRVFRRSARALPCSYSYLSQLFLFLCLAWLTGCAPGRDAASSTPVDFDEIAEMINSRPVGETLIPHERAALGMLGFDDQERAILTCASVLIRPDVILVAGHCFDSELNPGLKQNYVYPQANIQGFTRGTPGARRVVKVLVHHQYNSQRKIAKGRVVANFYDHDIAIALLDRPFDPGVAPQIMVPGNFILKPSVPLEVYGFGNARNYGDLREPEGHEKFRTRQAGMVLTSGKMVDSTRLWMHKISKSGLCQGDSGGPAYARLKSGERVIVGINSACSPGTALNPERTVVKCDPGGVIQLLAPMRPWIDEKLKEFGR